MNFADLICEIFDGYSEITFRNKTLFLRHINIHDQRMLNSCFERQKQRAIEAEVPTEKEKLEELKQTGEWLEKDELEIESKKSYIDNMLQTKKQLELKSQKKSLQDTIDAETAELNKLLLRRNQLVGKTAEDFANVRANEEFIRNIVYSDRELKQLAFSEEDFNLFEQEDLNCLVSQYSQVSQRINDDYIQEAVLSDHFTLYLGRIESHNFFSRSIVFLSINQLKVLAYGKMFLNIFQNVENIPESVKKSPKDLLDFVETQRKRQEKEQKRGKSHQMTGMVGASREDLDSYDPSAKKLDLAAELKKNGGKMTTEDFVKLANH